MIIIPAFSFSIFLKVDFTDWMSFLLSHLMEEISPNQKFSVKTSEAFHQHGIAEKK